MRGRRAGCPRSVTVVQPPFQVSVGAVLVGLFSPSSQTGGESTGIQPWVFVLVYSSFAGQGVALAIAFACHVRARWGRRLGGRTGEVLARRRVRARPWPETHLAQTAEVVAAMAAAVALVFVYWAAGGSFGLSSSHPHRSLGLQASRVAGAVAAAVGLPGLAGRWGSQRRFWLPAALTWLGSGALVAFDGLNLALNRLFGMFGTDASVPGWSVIDTALVIKWGSGCWPRLWVPSRSQPPPGTARHQLRKGSHTLVQLLAVVSGRRRLSCRRPRRPRSWSGIDDHSRFVVSARVWWPLQRRRARRVSQHAGDPPWVRCAPCAGGSFEAVNRDRGADLTGPSRGRR